MTVRFPAIQSSRIACRGTIAVTVVALGLAAATPANGQKGKPPASSVATVVFADRTDASGNPVDGLTSDGGGPYLNAAIEGEFGDLRLELAPAGRTVTVRLGTPLSSASGYTPPQDVQYSSNAVLFVNGLRGVARGQTVSRVGRIGLGSAYPNHAVGFRFTTSQGIEIFGTNVCVTRRDEPGAVWDVTSSCALEPSETAGLFEENLKGKVNHRFKATYAVPFAVTVTCTANCPQ